MHPALLIDEIPSHMLLEEMKRREALAMIGKCDYCERDVDTPPCKFSTRHAARRSLLQPPTLHFAALRAANLERVPRFGHTMDDWTISDWAMACTGELGELCNMLKKRRRGEAANLAVGKTTPTLDDVGDEFGDVVIYLDLWAAKVGVELGAAVRRKFNSKSEAIGAPQRI